MKAAATFSRKSKGCCTTCSLANVRCGGERPVCFRCTGNGEKCKWPVGKRGRKPKILKTRMYDQYLKSSYKKPRKACTSCSVLKRRCDSAKPSCSFCRSRQLQCEYSAYKVKIADKGVNSRKALIFEIFHQMELSNQFGEIDTQAIGIFLGHFEETFPALSPSFYLKCLEDLDTRPNSDTGTDSLCLALLLAAVACGVILGGFESYVQGSVERASNSLLPFFSSSDTTEEKEAGQCDKVPKSPSSPEMCDSIHNTSSPTSSPHREDNKAEYFKSLLNLHLLLLFDLGTCRVDQMSDTMSLISSCLKRVSSTRFASNGNGDALVQRATMKASWHWGSLVWRRSRSIEKCFPFPPPSLSMEELTCFPDPCRAFFTAQTAFLSLPFFTGRPLHASDTYDDFCCVLEATYSRALVAAEHVTMNAERLVSQQYVVSNLLCAMLDIVAQGRAEAGLARCRAILKQLKAGAAAAAGPAAPRRASAAAAADLASAPLLHLAAPGWAAPLRLVAHALWLGGDADAARDLAELHDAAAAARGMGPWAWPPGAPSAPGGGGGGGGWAEGPSAAAAAAWGPEGTGPVFGWLRALLALGLVMRGATLAHQRTVLYQLCGGTAL